MVFQRSILPTVFIDINLCLVCFSVYISAFLLLPSYDLFICKKDSPEETQIGYHFFVVS